MSLRVVMFIAIAAVIGMCGYAAARRPHTLPTVIISADPAPVAMPTGLPTPGRP